MAGRTGSPWRWPTARCGRRRSPCRGAPTPSTAFVSTAARTGSPIRRTRLTDGDNSVHRGHDVRGLHVRTGPDRGLRLARRGDLLHLRRPLPQRRPQQRQPRSGIPMRPPIGRAETGPASPTRSTRGISTTSGVNVLWISGARWTTPTPDAPGHGRPWTYSAYHSYWPTDLDATEEHFGTMGELQPADRCGARSRHEGAVRLRDEPRARVRRPCTPTTPRWFWPNDNGSGDNCVCGQGCGWEGADEKRCWFTEYLPDFDFSNAQARAFSVGNAIQWIEDTGVSTGSAWTRSSTSRTHGCSTCASRVERRDRAGDRRALLYGGGDVHGQPGRRSRHFVNPGHAGRPVRLSRCGWRSPAPC